MNRLSQKQTGSAHVIIIIALVVALVGALGYIFWQNFMSQKPVESQTNSETTTEKTSDVAVEDETVTNGTISGKAIYPSDRYPTGFKVCVVTKDTRAEVICDETMTNNQYSVEVSPGEYYVVARVAGYPDLEGYYDGYMKAGLTGSLCGENIAPILLTVASGSVTENIDAGNFYYLAENC